MLNHIAQNISNAQGPVYLRALAFVLLVGSFFSLPATNLSEGSDHEFHVSVTRIAYNGETKSFEVTLKLFTDDFERSLEGLGAPVLRLGSPRELPAADTIIGDYLNNRIAFFVDDHQMAFDYLGKEVELDNTTWCYLEISGIESFNSLRIRNKVLMELFDDQTNLVNIFVAGEKSSLLLKSSQPEDEATFNR